MIPSIMQPPHTWSTTRCATVRLEVRRNRHRVLLATSARRRSRRCRPGFGRGAPRCREIAAILGGCAPTDDVILAGAARAAAGCRTSLEERSPRDAGPVGDGAGARAAPDRRPRRPRPWSRGAAPRTRAGRGPAQAAAVALAPMSRWCWCGSRCSSSQLRAVKDGIPRRAAARGAGDARDLRAARQPARDLAAQMGARGPGVPLSRARRLPPHRRLAARRSAPTASATSRTCARELLRDAAAAAGITAEITGRPKHIYSIWRKMERKSFAFEQRLRRARGAHHRRAPSPTAMPRSASCTDAGTTFRASSTTTSPRRRTTTTLAAHRGDRARASAAGDPDPHARDARPRRARRRRALALQGRRRPATSLRAEDRLAAPAARTRRARRCRAGSARRRCSRRSSRTASTP